MLGGSKEKRNKLGQVCNFVFIEDLLNNSFDQSMNSCNFNVSLPHSHINVFLPWPWYEAEAKGMTGFVKCIKLP